MDKIKVTLIKSLIGSKPKQKSTADSLGLKKIGDSIMHDNNDVLAGKIKVIAHLVKTDNVIEA